jgi:histidine triad (HIT) family protein
MSDCIFCRIIRGEIPSAKVYEDDNSFAFLDIGPLSWGHTLLIPKKHYELITQMPADELRALASVLPRLSAAVIQAAAAEGLNVLQNNGVVSGQAVPHLHFHLIPRHSGDGLGYRWNAKRYPEGAMEEYHRKVLDALR